MGILDVFKRTRSSIVAGPRMFTLGIAGYGIEAHVRLPTGAAHLVDGTLVFGPLDVAAAKAQNAVRNVLVKPGTPPRGTLERRAIGHNSIVTYSTAERGTTQLVLGTGMTDHRDVLEAVRVADHPAQWRIVTDQIELAWPAKLSLRATGDLTSELGPFHLALEGSTLDVISLHGPLSGSQIPTAEQLASGHQVRIDAGTLDGAVRAIKHYTFEGDATAERCYLVPLDAQAIYLVRARCTIDKATPLLAAADAVCASLRPRR